MSKQRIILLTVAGAGLIAALLVWHFAGTQPGLFPVDPSANSNSNQGSSTGSSTGTSAPGSFSRGSPSPSAEESGFVGSQACADCHSEIATAYHDTHSMASSFYVMGSEPVIEDYEHAAFETSGRRRYQIKRSESQVQHHELLCDRSGNVLVDHVENVAYAIGSGRRGRTYLVERDGLLFQSPISWYTQRHAWDLGPGYEPARHARFDWRITKDCLFCHVGSMNFTDTHADRVASPAFPEPAIGCERCHGPGRDHVRRQQADPSAGVDPTIVNPDRLEPAQRDAVCYQCHLRSENLFLRAGRNAFDFRPGERYEDTWLAFVAKPTERETSVTIVEQLRSSACFQKSEGRLACTSCHDPHRQPAPSDQAGYYRQRCLTCHADKGCSVPVEKRQAAPDGDSCIACHMSPLPTKGVPHTALTDHRLRKDPKLRPLQPYARDMNVSGMGLFDGAANRLSPADVRRAQGLLFAKHATATNSGGLATEAERQFNPTGKDPAVLLDDYRNDHAVLANLGMIYVIMGRPQPAEFMWQRALQLEPTNETDLSSFVQFQLRLQNMDRVRELVPRLLEANPHLAEFHWLQSCVFQQERRLPEAIAAAERALARDPTAMAVRAWLVRAYAQSGQTKESEAHAAMLRDLR